MRLVPDTDGIFTVRREETRVDGWEFTGNLNLAGWLNFGAGLALLEGEYDSDADGLVDADLGAQDLGSDRLNLTVDIAPPGEWSYRIQSFTYFDRTFRSAAGNATVEFDGYTTVDALVAWQVHPTTQLNLGLVNLFDEQYLTYYSQAGNTRDDRYDAGRGRTLTLKAHFRF
jgi:iron complex outermembrane receptor protein